MRTLSFLLALGIACAAGEGLYQGTVKSDTTGSVGYFGMTVGPQTSSIGFNVEGREVVCTEAEVRVAGAKMTATCKFNYAREPHTASFNGSIAGAEVKGTYALKPTGPDGGLTDTGVFQAKRLP